MFCPKCGSLLYPEKGKVHCNSCGYERSLSGKDATVTKVARPGKEKPADTLVLDEITEDARRVSEVRALRGLLGHAPDARGGRADDAHLSVCEVPAYVARVLSRRDVVREPL